MDLARRVAQTLLDVHSHRGWGVRTVAAGEARYNSMSYHNGSVWSHDNSIVGLGLSRYGFKRIQFANPTLPSDVDEIREEVTRIVDGLHSPRRPRSRPGMG
jgi:glycogen debranching enzyme